VRADGQQGFIHDGVERRGRDGRTVGFEIGDIISILWAKSVVETRRNSKTGGDWRRPSGISGLISAGRASTLLATT